MKKNVCKIGRLRIYNFTKTQIMTDFELSLKKSNCKYIEIIDLNNKNYFFIPNFEKNFLFIPKLFFSFTNFF